MHKFCTRAYFSPGEQIKNTKRMPLDLFYFNCKIYVVSKRSCFVAYGSFSIKISSKYNVNTETCLNLTKN